MSGWRTALEKPKMRTQLIQLAMDIFWFVVLLTPLWLFNLTDLIQINKRGFYCSDNSIRYPYRPNTVPSITLFLVGVPVMVATAIFVEIFQYRRTRHLRKRSTFHPLLVAFYRAVGYFMVGATVNQFVTDTIKLTAGRLRPIFLDVCQPSVSCNLTAEHIYVLDYECTRTSYPGVSEKEFRHLETDIRKSFPSGHASFSIYCAVFMALFLEIRVKWAAARILKICLQSVSIASGLWVCCTRFEDNKHHPGDIVGGAVIGAVMAILAFVLYRRSIERDLLKLNSTQRNPAASASVRNGQTTKGHQMEEVNNATEIENVSPEKSVANDKTAV